MFYGLLRLLAFAFVALITFGLAATVVSAVRTGTVAVRYIKPLRRRKEPILFWGAVSANALMAIVMVAGLMLGARDWLGQ
jgi:hypothetical protein